MVASSTFLLRSSGGSLGLLVPPHGACLSSEGLDEWARDTNGTAFDQDSKEELLMFMDCTDEGGLT